MDIAGNVADKLDAIAANPAAGVLELNRTIANALGVDPVVTTTTPGASSVDR